MAYMKYDTFNRLLVETKKTLNDIEDISKILNCGTITTDTLGDTLIDAILSMLDEHFNIEPDSDKADIIVNWITDQEELTLGEIYSILTNKE